MYDGMTTVAPANGVESPTIAPGQYVIAEDAPAVIVTFKKRPPIAIEIDPDLLTWEDLTEFMDLQDKGTKGELSQKDMMKAIADLLTKVTGIDMAKQPGRVVSELMVELGKIAGAGNEDRKN